jgi:hypothetical protein
MGLEQPQLPAEECAIVISRFEVPVIVFVRGNHEHLNWLNFEWAAIIARHHAGHCLPHGRNGRYPGRR